MYPRLQWKENSDDTVESRSGAKTLRTNAQLKRKCERGVVGGGGPVKGKQVVRRMQVVGYRGFVERVGKSQMRKWGRYEGAGLRIDRRNME